MAAAKKKIVKSAKGRKKGNTGKRYPDELKAKIVAFVRKQGRGGITAAREQFGVSYIALNRWLKGIGGRKAGKAPKKGLDGRKVRRVNTALVTLKGVQKQIKALEKTLKLLRK